MNIGRCRRSFSARSTAPRPMIGSELAVDETTMSNSASRAGRSARRIASAPKPRRELLAALERAVRDRHAFGRARGEMGGRELDHLAGADEQHLRLAQVLEQLGGQAHRRGRHADRMAADLGRAAHFLGDRERALEHLLQRRAERAGAVGLAHRLLELAEDLRLAEHHRIEPARDAEGVARRRAAFEHVGVRARSVGVATPPTPASQSTAGATCAASRADVELGAVAGRDDRDLADPLQATRASLQRGRELLGREREAAAQVERRGRVVEAEGDRRSSPDYKIQRLRGEPMQCRRGKPPCASGVRHGVTSELLWTRSTPLAPR